MAWVTPRVWTSEAVRFLVTRAHMQEISDDLNALTTWEAFTPSWTNITLGAGTNVGRKIITGKRGIFIACLTMAADSAVTGSIYLNYPVNAAAVVPADYPLGIVTVVNASASPSGIFNGQFVYYNTVGGMVKTLGAAADGYPTQIIPVDATHPMTFGGAGGVGDKIMVQATYEVA